MQRHTDLFYLYSWWEWNPKGVYCSGVSRRCGRCELCLAYAGFLYGREWKGLAGSNLVFLLGTTRFHSRDNNENHKCTRIGEKKLPRIFVLSESCLHKHQKENPNNSKTVIIKRKYFLGKRKSTEWKINYLMNLCFKPDVRIPDVNETFVSCNRSVVRIPDTNTTLNTNQHGKNKYKEAIEKNQ